MDQEETRASTVKLPKVNYEHPRHPGRKIEIEVSINENELEKVIKQLIDDHNNAPDLDKHPHTRDIPTGIRGEATLP